MFANDEQFSELARKVAWLAARGAYLPETTGVEAIETHQSWVFLTDDRAYKLKKPVCTPHVDYSTVELRRRFCDEEVRLNRRLAPDVYLGVRGLCQAGDGFALTERLLQPGEKCEENVADWLVTMRRLPRERALDFRIAQRSVCEVDVTRAAEVLARFYARAERVAISGGDYRERLKTQVLRYRRELENSRFPAWNGSLDATTSHQLGFLDSAAELIEGRASSGHIVEGHGDLRPEHVFLLSEPVVIDCLEFDRELRVYDAVSEIAFLALECRRLGMPGVGETFLSVYERHSGDACPRPLLEFYQSQHACVRAAVALWHLDDPSVRDRDKWLHKAQTYLRLAHRVQALGAADTALRHLVRLR